MVAMDGLDTATICPAADDCKAAVARIGVSAVTFAEEAQSAELHAGL
jgi:hypothetical protein